MVVTFRTKQLEKCYEKSQQAVRAYGEDVARKYIQRINIIKNSENIDVLVKLPGLRCHPLKGNLAGQYSIKLTGFYRLIFVLQGEALNIVRIEEVSKHYDD